jgi:hypothetical protein
MKKLSLVMVAIGFGNALMSAFTTGHPGWIVAAIWSGALVFQMSMDDEP